MAGNKQGSTSLNRASVNSPSPTDVEAEAGPSGLSRSAEAPADPSSVESSEKATETVVAEKSADTAETREETKLEGEEVLPAGIHRREDDWTAVWSPEANAYYFWNSKSNVTTWENPILEAAEEGEEDKKTSHPLPKSTADQRGLAEPPTAPTAEDFGGIDPDLAYLDPNLARSRAGSSHAPIFKAAFNARTGRFQGDTSLNPDRISDYKRSERQQEAFYNKQAWEDSLDGKGLRNPDDTTDRRNKRPSSKDVEHFRQAKQDKKRKKLMAFLAN